jgi:hypothetical protein
MSKKNNVNADHYKLAGRDRPGDDILHVQNKQKVRQAKAASRASTPDVLPGAPSGGKVSQTASTSAMASQTDLPPAPPLYVHDEETPAGPVIAPQTEDEIAGEPIRLQAQPSLMDAWQRARDEERHAFVAVSRDALRLLLAAHDEPLPTKPARATRRPSRHAHAV